MDDDEVFFVEKVFDKRLQSDGSVEYFVKWKGYPDSDNGWYGVDDFDNEDARATLIEAIRRYDEEQTKLSPKKPVAKPSEAEPPQEEKTTESDPSDLDDQSPNATNQTEATANSIELPMAVDPAPAQVSPQVSPLADPQPSQTFNNDKSKKINTEELFKTPPIEILGMTNDYEGCKDHQFLMQWADQTCHLVKCAEANKLWPQLVIKFYENQLVLYPADS